MKKEIFIICIIIVFITVLHIVTQKYTENFFDDISSNLDKIQESILSQNNTNELGKDIDELQKKWVSKFNLFACFIEHDELEKVQTALISIDANYKVKEYNKCIDEIEKCKFILEHIENKDSLKIVNVF